MKRKIILWALTGLLLNAAAAWSSWDGQAPFRYVQKATRFFDVGLAELGSRGAFVLNGETGSADKYNEDYIGDWGELLGVPLHPVGCECGASYEVHWLRSQLAGIITKWSMDELDRLSQSLNDGVWDESLRYNSAAKLINNQAGLEYLVFSRELESMRCFLQDNWSYLREGYVSPTCYFLEFMEQALKGYENADTSDLRLRYAFQYLRLLFYDGRHVQAVAFYEKEIVSFSESGVKQWCRSFYGGSLYAMGRHRDALTEFAIVFHRSERYSESALNSFKIIAAAEAEFKWDFFIAYHWGSFASNAQRQYKLATLQGLYVPVWAVRREKDKVLNPVSAEEAVLVASVRSYIERDLNGALVSTLDMHVFNDAPPYRLEKLVAERIYKADHETEALLLQMAQVRDPAAFWYLAAAYVAIKHNDGKAALSHLEQAITHNAEKQFPGQLLVLQLYHEAALGSLDAESEARLAEMFTRQDAMYQFWTVPADAVDGDHKGRELTWRPEVFFARTADSEPKVAYATGLALLQSRRGLLESVLVRRYMEQGRYDRAFFCLAMVDEVFGDYFMAPDPDQYSKEFFSAYRSYGLYESRDDITAILSRPQAVEQIIRIGNAPDGAWENYFAAHKAPKYSPDVLHELWGLACILQHDFAAAIPALQNIRNVEWAMQRYRDKTVINPVAESHRFIFGPHWEDDFAGLWEGASKAGLSKTAILNLQRLMEAPETFLEFAEKMRDLELLSETSGEQSATAAYFYALGLFNMHTQVFTGISITPIPGRSPFWTIFCNGLNMPPPVPATLNCRFGPASCGAEWIVMCKW